MIRVGAALTFALALLAAVGCASDTETEPAGRDQPTPIYDDSFGDDVSDDELAEEEWDNQEGAAWEEFNDGYLAGWEEGCDLVFDESPDGSLYDQGIEYVVEDCYDLAPYDASEPVDVPYDLPADPYGEGEILGETEGCVAAFDELSSYGVLNWGEASFDETLCP